MIVQKHCFECGAVLEKSVLKNMKITLRLWMTVLLTVLIGNVKQRSWPSGCFSIFAAKIRITL